MKRRRGRRLRPPWPALLALLALLVLPRPGTAQQVDLLVGVSDRSDPSSTSYGWQLDFDKSIARRLAASLSWINEGHFAGHQRDGGAAQLWVAGPRWGSRGVGLDLGIGPYLYFDTQPADTTRGYSDVHGIGGVLSAALSMPFARAWLLDLRANEILTHDELSTFTLLAGVGYRFSLPGHELPAAGNAAPPPGGQPPVLELFGGENITNSLSTRQSAVLGIDYRLPIVRWAAWSASWFDDTHAPTGLHQRVASQGWLVDGPLIQHLTLGVGVGPYVLLGPLPPGRSSSARVSGLSALRADWRATGNLAVILTWYRTFTNDDLDRDLITLGLGWRFAGP
jgi:hypothetical protein